MFLFDMVNKTTIKENTIDCQIILIFLVLEFRIMTALSLQDEWRDLLSTGSVS